MISQVRTPAGAGQPADLGRRWRILGLTGLLRGHCVAFKLCAGLRPLAWPRTTTNLSADFTARKNVAGTPFETIGDA